MHKKCTLLVEAAFACGGEELTREGVDWGRDARNTRTFPRQYEADDDSNTTHSSVSGLVGGRKSRPVPRFTATLACAHRSGVVNELVRLPYNSPNIRSWNLSTSCRSLQ